MQEAAQAARLRASGASKEAEESAFVGEGGEADPQLALGSGAPAEDAEAIEADYQADLGKELRGAAGESDEGEDEEDEEGEDDGDEVDAKKGKGASAASKKRSSAAAADDLEETERMKDIMMTRKNRKLYERIKRAQEGKRERVEVLETRKRAVVQKEEAAATVKAPAPAAGKQQAKRRK